MFVFRIWLGFFFFGGDGWASYRLTDTTILNNICGNFHGTASLISPSVYVGFPCGSGTDRNNRFVTAVRRRGPYFPRSERILPTTTCPFKGEGGRGPNGLNSIEILFEFKTTARYWFCITVVRRLQSFTTSRQQLYSIEGYAFDMERTSFRRQRQLMRTQ